MTFTAVRRAEPGTFTLHVLLGDVIFVQPDTYAQVAFKLA